MTEVEIDRFWYPLDESIDVLIERNTEESGAPVCEKCGQFHSLLRDAPIRTMYADRNDPHPLLCPSCIDDWNEYWDYMWSQVPGY